ncbi:hypothetical protein HID58_094328 [Brassica napus]|uniref:Pentatricopeptide repeat-containing protein n=1 Tax=Brassica napus TaxID=3708 RepID=A0ABQ7X7U9_BRANA|nr:hypothetical protein HID58_094328 [Brassica napus]
MYRKGTGRNISTAAPHNEYSRGLVRSTLVAQHNRIIAGEMAGGGYVTVCDTFIVCIAGVIRHCEVSQDLEPFRTASHMLVLSGAMFSVIGFERIRPGYVKAGVIADNTTYAIIIDGLCVTGQVDTAKRFWDDVIWPSGRHDAYVYSAFLKGLCRFGSLSDACHFLYELADSGAVPNVVCYNIVIDECSRSGLRREAYQIVEEMRKNGQAPDAVTWRILDKLHDSRALAVEEE